jgi:DNA polymerase-3 subunit epsilon
MPRFAVVDVETSGLSSRRHRILQIGVVTVESDGTVVDQWSTFVRLRRPWSRIGPRRVHGITRRTLRGAPRAEVAVAELCRRLDGTVFTAHNADFDAAFIDRAAARAGVAPPGGRRLCTLQLSRRLDPDRQLTHGLADVCARYDITIERHHDALCDARATAAVLPHLLRAHGVVDVAGLEPLYVSERAAGRDPSHAPGRTPVGDGPRPAGGLVSGP